LQTDPVGSQDDLDLYAYVENDPSNATDPTGQWLVAGALIGAASGFIASAIAQKLANPNAPIDLAKAGRAAAVGALAGLTGVGIVQAVGSAAGKIAATVTSGAIFGGTSRGIENVAEGREASEGVGTAAAAGALVAGGGVVASRLVSGALTPLPSVRNAAPEAGSTIVAEVGTKQVTAAGVGAAAGQATATITRGIAGADQALSDREAARQRVECGSGRANCPDNDR
jgi:hypothetical protein